MLRDEILDLIIQEIESRGDWSDSDIDDVIDNDLPTFSEIQRELDKRRLSSARAKRLAMLEGGLK